YSLQTRGININSFPTTDPSQSKVRAGYAYIKAVFYFLRKLKFKYDVVHTHSMSLGLALKISGIKFVKTIHTSNNAVGLLNVKGIQEIAISKEIYAERANCFLKDKSRLNLIYNGVPDLYYRLNEESYNAKKQFYMNKIQILVVGTVTFKKGQDVLL